MVIIKLLPALAKLHTKLLELKLDFTHILAIDMLLEVDWMCKIGRKKQRHTLMCRKSKEHMHYCNMLGQFRSAHDRYKSPLQLYCKLGSNSLRSN